MSFWTYGLGKTWLDKRLKNPVSEDPLTSNVVIGPKHCWNLNGSTITIFIDPYEGCSRSKSLSEWYEKSYDCLLTHWLPITSILLLKESIYCSIFRANYITNKKYLMKFFLHFRNLDWILNIFNRKITLIAHVFLNLRTPKDVVK